MLSEIRGRAGSVGDSHHLKVRVGDLDGSADRFFGGPGGVGNASALPAPNCRGDALLAEGDAGPDDDAVNLFNPPSCAPDFTKNLNVTAIVLNVPIAQLGGGPVFDTWSTISVAE